MKKFKNVTFIGLNEDTRKQFEPAIIEMGIEEVTHFSNLLIDLKPDVDLVFYYVNSTDEEQVKKDLHFLRSSFPKVGIVMAMPNKNFDILLQAFYYNIRNILIAPFDALDIKQALMKSSILNDVSPKMPIQELLRLFSKPMKNTELKSLYNRLAEYFKLFDEVKNFSCYSIRQDKSNLIYGHELTEESTLSQVMAVLKKKKIKIGNYEVYPDNGRKLVFFPLVVSEDSEIIGGIQTESEEVDVIFNNYFLNYIEGTTKQFAGTKKIDELVKLSITDEVTGLYNQRKLSEDLELAIKSHEENHRNFSIMFIDVDHFKNVNDNWGHIVGSDMLYQMGNAIKNTLRGSDYVYRYGGDEFVVIMPNVDIETVHNIARRVFNSISTMEFSVGANSKHKLTVSIGISEYPTDAKSAKEIIQFADEMMYQSKKSGRGKIFHIKEIQKGEV